MFPGWDRTKRRYSWPLSCELGSFFRWATQSPITGRCATGAAASSRIADYSKHSSLRRTTDPHGSGNSISFSGLSARNLSNARLTARLDSYEV
jgi:hypothetical protein